MFSGIQPTGMIHIGNFVGAIKGWVRAQDVHGFIFCLVDLTRSPFLTIRRRCARRPEAAGILFAAGLDPDKCAVCARSQIPPHRTGLGAQLRGDDGAVQRMTQFRTRPRN